MLNDPVFELYAGVLAAYAALPISFVFHNQILKLGEVLIRPVKMAWTFNWCWPQLNRDWIKQTWARVTFAEKRRNKPTAQQVLMLEVRKAKPPATGQHKWDPDDTEVFNINDKRNPAYWSVEAANARARQRLGMVSA